MKNFTIIFLLFLIIFSANKGYSQTDEQIRAMWIFNIAYGVTWEDQENITKYTIGVFSSKKEILALENLASTRTINGKPVEIIKYTSYENIEPHHIVYVTRNENTNLPFVYEKLVGKNTLIISDRAKQSQYSVINLRKTTDQKQPFSINTVLYKKQKLIFAPTVLTMGGDREILKKMQAAANRKLKEEQRILELKKIEIAEKEELLKKHKEKIQAQRDSISSKENLITLKEGELEKQNLKLDSMSFEVMKQQEDLNQNKLILKQTENNIKKQHLLAKLQRDSMIIASEELKKKQEEIKKIDKRLSKSETTVESQQNIIYWFIGAGILFSLLLLFIIISFFNKQKINKQLSEQYVSINNQKNEIQEQSKQLESANSELEKLSLVASETDNAITIMDVKGNFEWVNAGFTRMYGYTLQLLRNELDENIVVASGNPEVQKTIEKIIETKQTGSYQNLNKTRRGSEIWAQTTITPILDENNEVTKLISIDTDITVEKKSEIEIIKQRDKIEIQNEQITSSISYAKNIQQAILPLPQDIDKYFDSFIIFKPRDVVSGDFYWFTEKFDKDGNIEKVFISVVDCTGHGVPGAFMSMIGSRLLSEIVLEQKIESPKDILENLDSKVKLALRQESTDNNDGMDMSICVIEKEDNKFHITYSGAKSELYYFSHKDEDITIVSSERRSIGGVKQKRGNIDFVNKDFYLSENDCIWLATDGIIDQNNAERKRFGTPKFIETIKKAKNMSLSDQKHLFEDELAKHQGDEEQRDDITIWGLKLSNDKF